MANAINTTNENTFIINWSDRIMPKKSLVVPTEEAIRNMFTDDQATRFGYTSSFLGRMVVFYCRYIVIYYCRRHGLNFKGHCREMKRLLEEFESAMRGSVSLETDRWVTDTHWEFIQKHKFDIIEQLKYAIVNDILKANPDCEDMDVAYGVNAALLIIQEMDDNGDYITAETNRMLGVTHLSYSRADVLTLIKVLLVDMAETLNCKVEWSAPTKTGVKVITNKFMELINKKWNEL